MAFAVIRVRSWLRRLKLFGATAFALNWLINYPLRVG
jgi:hypothetical protein